jgi:hypothetical protein
MHYDTPPPPWRHVATAVDELTYVSFPIEKFERDVDGDLVVYGKATDGSVDSDDQIVEPGWSAKAMEDWKATGGNVRVQHQARRDPAGKALSIEIDRDGDGGHWLKALVVEPVAKRLVEKGVLTAYSVGISRPVIKRDPTGKARGGIVAGGELAEVSLVDRPANKHCGLVLAKSAGDGPMELVGEVFGEPDILAKAAEDADLLTKDDSADPDTPGGGDASEGAPTDNPDDDGADTSEGAGDTSDDSDDGMSKAEDADPIADADEQTRAAYKAARQEWLGREPSIKGVANGTEYLTQRSAWMRWHAEGDAEGLGGDRSGALLWLAKRGISLDEASWEVEDEVLKTAGVTDKRDFTAGRRRELAQRGHALPNGSYPIENEGDLANAATLARSGHGDVGAGRRLIARRARELGVANPLSADDQVKKRGQVGEDGTVGDRPEFTFDQEHRKKDAATSGDSANAGDGGDSWSQCPTCKGDGKIMGNNRKCPDCGGSGKMPKGGKDAEPEAVKAGARACKGCGKNFHADSPAKFCDVCGKKLPSASKAAKRAATDILAATLAKSVEMGLISAQAAEEILAQATMDKASRPLPGDTKPVGAHREPDGTSTVERLEPDAGLPTDPDSTPDRVPDSVKAEVPYSAHRMHDVMCAAYEPSAILATYPSLKSAADAVDEAWFAGLAAEAAAGGKADDAAAFTRLLQTAQAVKGMDPAAVADGHALLHKAFQDMYPSEHIKPGDGIKPGQFHRPYLSGPTASEDARDRGAPHIPPTTHTPEPEQFDRPLITDGHEADSPANGPANNRVSPGTPSGARTYYTNASRDQARTALAAMHDHIAASFPDLCPMASSKTVMPPDLGARNVPTPEHPGSMGGISTVGKAADAEEVGRQIRKAVKRAAREAAAFKTPGDQPPVLQPLTVGLDAEQIKALLTEQIVPITDKYQAEIDSLRKQLDDLGSQPDPVMAPVRGALTAKSTSAAAVPVERRSLIDEAAQKARDRAAAEEMAYRTYVEIQARSADPGTREKALSVLDSLNKATAPATT